MMSMITSTLKRNRRRSRLLQVRPASVLVLTLVVVAMLTLGAAAFFERMFAEHQASQLADSGVEYMKVLLSRDPQQVQDAGGLYANPSLFQGIVVNDDPMAAFRGRFTLFAPDLTAKSVKRPRKAAIGSSLTTMPWNRLGLA